MQDFRNLQVWEKSHQFVLSVYKMTISYPSDEKYGLTAQIRRAASSIPTNIAEGCGRGSNPGFARFLQISMGSASGVEYQIILSRDLGIIPPEQAEAMEENLVEIKKMLNKLIQRVQSP